jgi:hypothetical protein
MISMSWRTRRRVVGKAEDVAGIGADAGRLPGEQHLAVFGDLVLPLFSRRQVVGIDVLEADENARHAGALRLGDEVGYPMAQGVHLDQEAYVQAVSPAPLNDSIEDGLPILVAGEVVVGDEKAIDPLRPVGAQDAFDVVGAAPAGLASLHVDDGAERALERAAASGIEAGHALYGPAHPAAGEQRHDGARERRQVVDEIVGRPQAVRGGVAQDLVHAAFGFPGKQRDPHVEGLLQVGRRRGEHRKHAGDMEPADDDRDAGGAQRPGDVEGARILVGLHAHEADEAEVAAAAEVRDDLVEAKARVGLVGRRRLDVDVGAEQLPGGAVGDQGVDRGERVRRHRRAIPAGDVTVVVVMGRLDQDDGEPASRRRHGRRSARGSLRRGLAWVHPVSPDGRYLGETR